MKCVIYTGERYGEKTDFLQVIINLCDFNQILFLAI